MYVCNFHYSSLHGSLSSSRFSLAEIGVEIEGEAKEDAEGKVNIFMLSAPFDFLLFSLQEVQR